MKMYFCLISVLLLSACVPTYSSEKPIPATEVKVFTYDYKVPGKSMSDQWRKARDYFAGVFGDSRSVFRVMDEKDGSILGKALFSWRFSDNIYAGTCHSEYHIRFIAKENKSRLQLELIDGAPALSKCSGWSRPSRSGYNKMKSLFVKTSKDLESALNDQGVTNKLRDF